MINFEEELAKFRPSKEIETTDDLVMEDNLIDVTDIMIRIMNEYEGGTKD